MLRSPAVPGYLRVFRLLVLLLCVLTGKLDADTNITCVISVKAGVVWHQLLRAVLPAWVGDLLYMKGAGVFLRLYLIEHKNSFFFFLQEAGAEG